VKLEDYPKALMYLEQQSSDDEASWQYLFDLQWPAGFRCQRCQCAQAWKMPRELWLCVACRHQVSVTASTIPRHARSPYTLSASLIRDIIPRRYWLPSLTRSMMGLIILRWDA
jgi:hypothetical protein